MTDRDYFAAPPTWQEEVAAVEAAFERSGTKPTWPDDEPGNIGPMAAAMADEIELLRGYRDAAEADAAVARLLVDKLRLTDAEREAVEWFAEVRKPLTRLTQSHNRERYKDTLRGLLEKSSK